jgi:hypothetical protein
MRKRNSFSYEIVKSLFDPNAEGENGGCYFRVAGGTEPVTITIPTSIMHRLFRLGQAYGIRQLRYFEPNVRIVVGAVELPEFVHDLRRLVALVNDEVLHEYVNRLLQVLEAPPGIAAKHIAVATGSFYGSKA